MYEVEVEVDTGLPSSSTVGPSRVKDDGVQEAGVSSGEALPQRTETILEDESSAK
jgi:hypothetical protein